MRHRLLPTLLLAGAAMLGVAATAHAGPVETFKGTLAFGDDPTNPVNQNDIQFIANPGSGWLSPTFNFTGGVGYTFADTLHLTLINIDPASSTETDNLFVKAVFTLPNLNTTDGVVSGTGSSTFTLDGSVSFNEDKITWNGDKTVNFLDGSALTLHMDDVVFSGADRTASVDDLLRMTVTRVPEPASLALFGVGLLGLAMAVKRRRFTGAAATTA